jgi:peptidoglycan/xylan/chitin deacetylase (PgdA/CDA1 family)
MRLYFYRTPILLKKIYPDCIWNIATNEKVIYLTFDDGPVPEATPFVLDQLEAFNARATFFVVGDNVNRYPEIFRQVVAEGHTIGNHTYHHLKGWRTNTKDYQANVQKCQQVISSNGFQRDAKPLFRPPYGRITKDQIKSLLPDYDIVMWQLLSGDFDKGLNHRSSWAALGRATKGDIVVFHDSQKYLRNVKLLLPRFLQHFTELGFRFDSL